MGTGPDPAHEADQAPAPALDEQLDAVSRTVAALREDGPPPQHITVRAADVTVELSWAEPAPRPRRPAHRRPLRHPPMYRHLLWRWPARTRTRMTAPVTGAVIG